MVSLNQIPDDKVISFLKKFTIELVLNSRNPDEVLKEKVEQEKTKQKLLRSIMSPEEAFKQVIKSPIFHEEPKPSDHMIKSMQYAKPRIQIPTQKPLIRRSMTANNKIMPTIPKPTTIARTSAMPRPNPQINSQQYTINKQANQIKPQLEKRPEGFNLGKLEQLLRDQSVQSIECSGPGKNLLVKRRGQINITSINLNQEEIQKIIKNFSEKARIPVVGGILKAAVGDAVISAVISEFVGSRFIINKITPYNTISP
jgi:hypothetical protein